MRGGPNRTLSLKEKKANGTYRKDRDTGRLEEKIEPVSKIPAAPSTFDKRHSTVWVSVCTELIEHATLTELDYNMVKLLVENMVIAQDAWQSINDQGAILWVEMAGGSKPIKNPAHSVYMECMKVIRSISESFGMTPKSRQYLKVEKKETKGASILELMKGGKKAVND